MESQLLSGFIYRDTARDITENDLDVVSDLWTIDGREVYRGSRDPRYTHANVYWLYSETLERVGLCEHSLTDQADFRTLWFQDTDFGTYLQEEGWEQSDDIWTRLPRHAFDRFINEGWTTPDAFLEQCLHGHVRVFTPAMIEKLPTVYTCSKCGKKSLRPSPGCSMTQAPLDFPDTQCVFFVDSDMIMYRPPASSRVWDLLTPRQQPSHDDDSQQQAQEKELQEAQSPLLAPEPSPPQLEAQRTAEAVSEQEQPPPPQSHP